MPFEMCDFLFQTKYTGIPASIRAFDRAIAQFTWPRVAQGAVWRELTEVVIPSRTPLQLPRTWLPARMVVGKLQLSSAQAHRVAHPTIQPAKKGAEREVSIFCKKRLFVVKTVLRQAAPEPLNVRDARLELLRHHHE